MPEQTPVHLVIPTHTPRYLDFVCAGVARQTVVPATVTVTSDVVHDDLERAVGACAGRFGLTIRYVRRSHQGQERLAQVRNNAVRALLESGVTGGRLLFLDGDTYPCPECVELHARLGADAEMVLPYRINLTEAQTKSLDVNRLFHGEQLIEATDEQWRALRRVHQKGRQHQFWRRLRLARGHKPKLLGGHHSVTLDVYRTINGHDEEYHTWGTEDDDFCRRAYRCGARSRVAAVEIPVYHLYHPTRAPENWHDRPNAERFKRRDLPMRCVHGLENPRPQEAVIMDIFGAECLKSGLAGGLGPAASKNRVLL